LIFALLLNDVEAKTYEYGMLRALGMPSKTLIQVPPCFLFPLLLCRLLCVRLIFCVSSSVSLLSISPSSPSLLPPLPLCLSLSLLFRSCLQKLSSLLPQALA
jgi:hypothetical protein